MGQGRKAIRLLVMALRRVSPSFSTVCILSSNYLIYPACHAQSPRNSNQDDGQCLPVCLLLQNLRGTSLYGDFETFSN
ncbi:hypothetical protein BDV12DRAFT_181608, partial [Aspergillus spectabilis]